MFQTVLRLNGPGLGHETQDFKVLKNIFWFLMGLWSSEANHTKHLPILFKFGKWLTFTNFSLSLLFHIIVSAFLVSIWLTMLLLMVPKSSGICSRYRGKAGIVALSLSKVGMMKKLQYLSSYYIWSSRVPSAIGKSQMKNNRLLATLTVFKELRNGYNIT